MIVVGIDPGLGGGVAVLKQILTGRYPEKEPTVLDAFDMPVMSLKMKTKTRNTVDGQALFERLEPHRPSMGVIETVSSMPGQGVASMFSQGRSLGKAEAVLEAMCIPYVHVMPKVWKAEFGLQGLPREESKPAAIAQAQKMFGVSLPRKKDDGIAEALFIACWALRVRQ